jgi:hypothetical protein
MAESDINQVLFPADWAAGNVLSAHLNLSRTPERSRKRNNRGESDTRQKVSVAPRALSLCLCRFRRCCRLSLLLVGECGFMAAGAPSAVDCFSSPLPFCPFADLISFDCLAAWLRRSANKFFFLLSFFFRYVSWVLGAVFSVVLISNLAVSPTSDPAGAYFLLESIFIFPFPSYWEPDVFAPSPSWAELSGPLLRNRGRLKLFILFPPQKFQIKSNQPQDQPKEKAAALLSDAEGRWSNGRFSPAELWLVTEKNVAPLRFFIWHGLLLFLLFFSLASVLANVQKPLLVLGRRTIQLLSKAGFPELEACRQLCSTNDT